MTLGKVLATAGMMDGYHVTWFPSYGAEVRGGTANAKVRISNNSIGSPTFDKASTAFVMNGPSLDKFEDKVESNGTIILNSSMADKKVKRKDVKVIEARLTDEAIKLGSAKVANIIAMGVFISKTKLFSKNLLEKVIKTMAGKNTSLIDINIKALERGIEIGLTNDK